LISASEIASKQKEKENGDEIVSLLSPSSVCEPNDELESMDCSWLELSTIHEDQEDLISLEASNSSFGSEASFLSSSEASDSSIATSTYGFEENIGASISSSVSTKNTTSQKCDEDANDGRMKSPVKSLTIPTIKVLSPGGGRYILGRKERAQRVRSMLSEQRHSAVHLSLSYTTLEEDAAFDKLPF
jgi:hypothetical protein